MKVDLDELERKVRKFYDGNSDEWELTGREMLALIAHIRELECAMIDGMNAGTTSGMGPLEFRAFFDRARDLLEKGAVLP